LAVPGGALGKGSPTRATVDFTIRDITGKRFRLAERLEKGPVLLDFWALWCVPCLKELPELAKIWSRFQGSGLSVVAVNEDAPADQAKVKPFIKRKRYGFTVAFDEDSDLWQQFNIDALPTVILLDRNGDVAYRHTGYKPGDEAELVTRIEQLFERDSPP